MHHVSGMGINVYVEQKKQQQLAVLRSEIRKRYGNQKSNVLTKVEKKSIRRAQSLTASKFEETKDKSHNFKPLSRM